MKKRILLLAILAINISLGIAQKATYDPLLDKHATIITREPQKTGRSSYMWYPGQLAAFQQQKCKEISQSRCVNVGYPGKFFAANTQAYFKKTIRLKEATAIRWTGPEKITLFVNGNEITSPERNTVLPLGKHTLLFQVKTNKTLPCIIVEGNKEIEDDKGWYASMDNSYWTIPESSDKYKNPEILPDDASQNLVVELKPIQIRLLHNSTSNAPDAVTIKKNGYAIVDFFHLEVGTLSFRAKGKGAVTVRVGETPEEALNTNEKLFEQFAIPPFTLSENESEIRLPERALRYASIECSEEAEISSIKFSAAVWPVEHQMQFESDDTYINNLFNMSSATLHTSMHYFYLDGIKRDFLPWAMDAIVSTFAGDYLFGDQQVSKNGISISLMPFHPQLSDLGVTDYPLHALIGLKQNYKRYGDIETSYQYKDRIIQLIDFYDSIVNEDGFLPGKSGSAGYIPGWSTKNGPTARGIASYPQIMLYCNYQIAADFADRWKEKDRAKEYRKKAERIKKNIFEKFWDEERKAFINGTNDKGEIDKRISHHAQYWAILADIFPEEYYDNLFKNILPNIPYYYEDISFEKGYEMLAYAKANKIKELWSFIDRVFGDWMHQGHSRFPENFSPKASGEKQLTFYNRPYGLSLCHGANGVPVVVGVLNGLIGFSQSDKKTNEYTIRPELLHLQWINARIPIKEGYIKLKLKANGENEIEIPAGCIVNVINQDEQKTIRLREAGTYKFALSSSVQASSQTKRTRDNFDSDWLFHLGNLRIERAVKAGKYGGITDTDKKVVDGEVITIAYNDKDKAEPFNRKDWTEVTLPHDWCVEGQFVNDKSVTIDGAPQGLVSHGFLPVGVGFYRKEFAIPESDKGKKISIEFDGIFRNSTVWVNGHLMGNHLSGYIPSHYDLTDVLRYGDEGENVILVKVDATDFEGWWYEGCGIYRHVWLIKTDKLHVARYGTYVTTPQISAEQATVNIQTTLENEYREEKEVTIISKIKDEKGGEQDVQHTTLTIGAFNKVDIQQKGDIQHPQLWSPETPNLYTLTTEIMANGKVVDTYHTSFGVRTAEVRKDGFYLNGKHYLIKGTANHQDFAGVGVAVPDKINQYRIKLLKEMGCNGYRTAHNPAAPELLDICDRMGMLFLNENRMLSSTEDGLKDLETLILRDRNHPSVFMWCLENEEPIEGTPIGARILQTMADLTRKLDPGRQITAGMNHGWNAAGYSNLLDVVGYNYGQRDSQYVKDKEQYPDRLMIVTESTSFVATRGEYEDNFQKGYVSNMGKGVGWGMLPGKDWEQIVDYPYLGGQFTWTGFDYRGEPTPIYKWPSVTSHFGIMDLCGFPKDGYYAYKAAWTESPVIHIFPHWNWPDKIGKKIKVMGYTNCDEVELLINGKSIGKQKAIPYNRLEWEVVYTPGKIEARGYKAGKVIIKQVRETTTAPVQIALTSDCGRLKADGCDVAIINVVVKDSKKRVVPTADNLIKFTLNGPGKIIGTGNGNPSSHEPDKANQRKAFNGYCQVLVQSGKTAGEIVLKATANGLQETEVVLKVE